MTKPISSDAVFKSTLLDASTRQPDIIIDSTDRNKLIWTLSNNQGKYLVIKPFKDKKVSKDHYHFSFSFSPGSLTVKPTLPGWKTAVEKDSKGVITKLYLALDGNEALMIGPGKDHQSKLVYTKATQQDSNNSKMRVTITAGKKVTLGGNSINGKSFGPSNLTLVKASVAAQAASPISVDFVGRRTVLNDGETSNSFSFAITNMVPTDLKLEPQNNDNTARTGATVFTVWFDAAPNQPDKPSYPWALARIEDLASEDVSLKMPSAKWQYQKLSLEAKSEGISGNPRWHIILEKPVQLKPQDPVLFTFSGIKTDLDPGFTRMYLKYENVPGFHDGILISELEKTSMLYGSERGQGVYISAGEYEGDTPPEPQYGSALNVRPFGDNPAATFYRGKGVDDGELELTSSDHGWNFNIKADAEEKKHIGIGTTDPEEKLDVNGTVKAQGLRVDSKREIRLSSQPIVLSLEKNGGGQLVITNNHDDNKIFLEGFSKDFKDSADAIWICGRSVTKVDSLHLHAKTTKIAGRVGIGTIEPNEKLEIADPKGARVNVSDGKGKNRRTILIQAPSEDNNDYGRILAHKYGKEYGGINLILQDSGGNVGIGTTDPEEKLDIKGTVKAQGLQVDSKKSIRLSAPEIVLSLKEKGGGQLVICNTKKGNDDKIYLEGYSKDFKSSAKAMIICGRNVAKIPLLDLHAKETTVGGDLKVEGTTYCKGPLKYHWGPDDAWKHINNRAGDWAGSSPTSGPSDMRFKEGVNPIQNALTKVSQLNGVFYRWNDKGLDYFAKDIESTISAGPGATKAEHEEVWQAEREKLHKELSKTYAGVIAQDVESVLPEAVTEDEDGYKSVQYHSLIPLLIEAIKEQSDLVARQQEEIGRLRSAREKSDQKLAELETVKAKVSKLEAAMQHLLNNRETNGES